MEYFVNTIAMLSYVGALYYLGMKIITSKVRASEDALWRSTTNSFRDLSEGNETKTCLEPESLGDDGGLSDPITRILPTDSNRTLLRRVIYFLG
jgi:hypothetical protein